MARTKLGIALTVALWTAPVWATTLTGCSAAGDGTASLVVVEDAPNPNVVLDHLDQALVGFVGRNPNPLTFWWYGSENVRSMPTLECALGRIRAATCLPLDVSLDAHHWFRFVPPEAIPGFGGFTSGTWDSTRIRVTTESDAHYACGALVHEIAEHVLRRRNDHAVSVAGTVLSSELLASVCARHDCGCFIPELPGN